MNWIENLLIIAGISLDIFAVMECQGSLVARVDKKQLGIICVVIAAWQSGALTLGKFLSELLYRNEMSYDEKYVGLVLAAAIFFCLGVRLVIKAAKRELIHEHREEKIGLKRLLRMIAVTSIYTLLTGVAFGFLGTVLADMLITAVCVTVVVVIAGLYTGYRLGFEQKTKAYVGGAALLWIAGIDVIVGHILH